MIKSLKDFWNNRVTVSDEVVFERSLLLCDPMEDMEFISSVWWCWWWWWEWCVSRCEWRIALTNFRHHRQGGRALFWTSIIFFLDFDVWHPPQKRTQNSLKFFDNLPTKSLPLEKNKGRWRSSFFSSSVSYHRRSFLFFFFFFFILPLLLLLLPRKCASSIRIHLTRARSG